MNQEAGAQRQTFGYWILVKFASQQVVDFG
jgi:hypothetical protein